MKIRHYDDKIAMGRAAAAMAADTIIQATTERGHARIIAATGASQFDFLEALVGMPGIDW